MNETRQIVAAAIRQILAEKGAARDEPQDQDHLIADLGLDSLDLAVLVVRLEQQLGNDPFRDGRPGVPTFGQLVDVYQETQGAQA